MTITLIHKWAEPIPGQEERYARAWKHRSLYSRLMHLTPWWQLRKKRRRHQGWCRAVDRTKIYGQDIIQTCE